MVTDCCRVTETREIVELADSLGLDTAESIDSSEYGDETAVERYYRFHSVLYDATRWTFLFGRSEILRRVAAIGSPASILEVGCGTGRNLIELGRLFPQARITAVDLSAAMLQLARRKTATLGDRIELLHRRYDASVNARPSFDLVLFSYSLSMFNPGFEKAIESAWRDLMPGGLVAVVDFHDTQLPLMSRWMQFNCVRTDGQLRPLFQNRFATLHDELRVVCGGVWRYLMFVGEKA